MPQSLTEDWQHDLGPDWEATHELFLHTLGNLTLTGYNSELSNHNFETKKLHLVENSHFELNRYFKDQFAWRKEDILKRSEYLAETSLAIWPYFGIEKSEQANVTGTTPNSLKILGQEFDVDTWSDVLVATMDTIAELEPEKFNQIIKEFSRFIGWDKSRFDRVRELKNGAFVATKLRAQDIQSLCYQVIEAIELTPEEDWKVVLELDRKENS